MAVRLLGVLVTALVAGCASSAGQAPESAQAQAAMAPAQGQAAMASGPSTKASSPSTSAQAPKPTGPSPAKAASPVDTSAAQVNAAALAFTPAGEASLQGYPTLERPLSQDCKAPYVAAASAPASAAKRDSWYWPWVVQAIVAQSNVFHVAVLPPLQANDVQFVERATAFGLSLNIHCGSAQTCNLVARVLRALVPKNQASVGCGSPKGEPTGRSVVGDELALTPFAQPGQALDAGSACARLAACSRQQDASVDVAKFLACQSKPADFPIQCATQQSCYGVAICAKHRARSLDLAFGVDLEDQLEANAVRMTALGAVPDVGGGGLDPGSVNAVYLGANAVDANRPGDWVTFGFDVSLEGPDAEGNHTGGVVSWAPAFVERQGAHVVLGPTQTTSGDPFNTINVPAMASAFGHSQIFDYDGDGIPELLLHAINTYHTSSPKRRLSIWKYTPKGVVRYPGTEGLPVIDVDDVDNDGRPDLVLDLGETPEDSDRDSSLVPEGWELAHSLPNGRFSMTDAVCAAYNAEHAPSAR